MDDGYSGGKARRDLALARHGISVRGEGMEGNEFDEESKPVRPKVSKVFI